MPQLTLNMNKKSKFVLISLSLQSNVFGQDHFIP